VHQITNHVVVAQSANATLALGASPIMATAPEEMDDLAKVAGGLLVNFGTVTNKAGMLVAGELVFCPSASRAEFVVVQDEQRMRIRSLVCAYGSVYDFADQVVVVFDPVGIGATRFRYETANGESSTFAFTVRALIPTIRTFEHLASQYHQRKCWGNRCSFGIFRGG
jgi:thiamine-phosphate diphosphorylase/hydroxyethylthiazole kinase